MLKTDYRDDNNQYLLRVFFNDNDLIFSFKIYCTLPARVWYLVDLGHNRHMLGQEPQSAKACARRIIVKAVDAFQTLYNTQKTKCLLELSEYLDRVPFESPTDIVANDPEEIPREILLRFGDQPMVRVETDMVTIFVEGKPRLEIRKEHIRLDSILLDLTDVKGAQKIFDLFKMLGEVL